MKFKENGRGTNCAKGGLCRALWMVLGGTFIALQTVRGDQLRGGGDELKYDSAH